MFYLIKNFCYFRGATSSSAAYSGIPLCGQTLGTWRFEPGLPRDAYLLSYCSNKGVYFNNEEGGEGGQEGLNCIVSTTSLSHLARGPTPCQCQRSPLAKAMQQEQVFNTLQTSLRPVGFGFF